jgi:DNA mismatch repair protein MutS2
MRGYEALAEIQQFLDEAVMTESMELTILHGKGNGILRQLIRDYLASLNFVKTWKDAHADRGGAGITVVVLDV